MSSSALKGGRRGLALIGIAARMKARCAGAIILLSCSLKRQTPIVTQVLSLDRKFLDPRRPVGKPSADDMEEMLVPYQPFMPIIPTAVLSYNNTIQQVCDGALRLLAWVLRVRAPYVGASMCARVCAHVWMRGRESVFVCALVQVSVQA